MENGTEAPHAITEERTVPCGDVIKTADEHGDMTQIESKTTTVVVQSERSSITTSTLSTEPVLLQQEVSSATERQIDQPTEQQESTKSTEVNVQSTQQVEEEVKISPLNTDKEPVGNVEEPQSDVAQMDQKIEEKEQHQDQEDQKILQEQQQKEKEQLLSEQKAQEQLIQAQEQQELLQQQQKEQLLLQQQQEEQEKQKQLVEETAPESSETPNLENSKMPNVAIPSQMQKEEIGSAEIQDGNIKSQLQEIINEIDFEVSKDEDGVRHHTWKPKGNYEFQKTEIQYEDIVPVEIPDVTFAQRKKEAEMKIKSQKVEEPPRKEIPMEPLKILRQTVANGEPVSPLEIPAGIPLLARILPKSDNEDEEAREKIPLERLFTPATDTGEIVPHKKKAFASSCFYRPDHPTIDDQVELAHKISVSLIDENNKTSKGQNMYMKRKNRSSKWVHQGEELEMAAASSQFDSEDMEEEQKPSSEKPKLKLLMNPKGVHDYGAVQQHYEELMTTSQASQQIARMEVGMEIANNLESPTGKGAALFAKRKKRMDKFIVDETNVQQNPAPVYEEMNSTKTNSTLQSSSFSSNQIQEFSQSQLKMSPQINGPSLVQLPSIIPPGNPQLPDLSQILTTPKPSEKPSSTFSSRSVGRSKPTTNRSKSADSKPIATKSGLLSFNSHYSPIKSKAGGEAGGKKTVSGSYLSSSSKNILEEFQKPLQEPFINLRPGSPPVFLVPDGVGEFIEKQAKTNSLQESKETMEATTNNEGGAIYTAEVKVVQNTSLPTTPIIDLSVHPQPSYSVLEHLSTSKEEEKRKSFNLAPKGWGTYTNFYTPLHLGAR